jgi:hypothetical protein
MIRRTTAKILTMIQNIWRTHNVTGALQDNNTPRPRQALT